MRAIRDSRIGRTSQTDRRAPYRGAAVRYHCRDLPMATRNQRDPRELYLANRGFFARHAGGLALSAVLVLCASADSVVTWLI